MSIAELYLQRSLERLWEGRSDYFDDFPYDVFGDSEDELYEDIFDDSPCESVDDGSDEDKDGGDPFKGMVHSQDTEPKLMYQRKRAMVLGKFKFLSRGDGSELETSEAFVKAVKEKASHIVEYKNKVHQGESKRIKVAKETDVRLPGYGDRFTVVWSTEDGEIMTDQAVKLYMPVDVVTLEELSKPGPKSPWFGLVDPGMTHDKRIGFDANNFWSVGLLFKHLGTCGVGKWDKQLQELQRTFRWTSSLLVGGSGATLAAEGQASNPASSGRLKGRITEWRGTYGFIKPQQSSGPQRVFVHRTDVQHPIPRLRPGTTLEFDICEDPQHPNPKAVNVVAL